MPKPSRPDYLVSALIMLTCAALTFLYMATDKTFYAYLALAGVLAWLIVFGLRR